MKKKTTVEKISESEKTALYSISFEKDGTTEFEKFVEEFEQNAKYNRDYQRIIAALQAILNLGALERFFRPEGKIKDSVAAIPKFICFFILWVVDYFYLISKPDYVIRRAKIIFFSHFEKLLGLYYSIFKVFAPFLASKRQDNGHLWQFSCQQCTCKALNQWNIKCYQFGQKIRSCDSLYRARFL